MGFRCVNCQKVNTDDTHVMEHFLTWRIGTRADQIGAKLGYVCASCQGPLCVDCLGLRAGYPCPPEEVEFHPFKCPRCEGQVSVVLLHQAGSWEAPALFRDVLSRMVHPPTAGNLVPYSGYDPVVQVESLRLVGSSFGPPPVPLSVGDLWRSIITLELPGEEIRTLVLHRWDHPSPRVDVLVERGRELLPIGTLEADRVYYDRDLWKRAGISSPTHIHFSLSLGPSGFYVAQLQPGAHVKIHKIGVVQGSSPPPARSQAEFGVAPVEDTTQQHLSRETVARLLAHLTELAIWDYTWLEAPRPEKFGKGAILALAGSTDLMYYHLVRVVFKGVLYNDIPTYFHHPGFKLASPATTRQMQDLVPWGSRSKLICLDTDRGGFLEQTHFVVADYVFVLEEGMDVEYRPSRPANVDWW